MKDLPLGWTELSNLSGHVIVAGVLIWTMWYLIPRQYEDFQAQQLLLIKGFTESIKEQRTDFIDRLNYQRAAFAQSVADMERKQSEYLMTQSKLFAENNATMQERMLSCCQSERFRKSNGKTTTSFPAVPSIHNYSDYLWCVRDNPDCASWQSKGERYVKREN